MSEHARNLDTFNDGWDEEPDPAVECEECGARDFESQMHGTNGGYVCVDCGELPSSVDV